MKKACLLLLFCLLSGYGAFAQSHFITAGQTQNMIFTDVVPDYYFPSSISPPGYYMYTFDVNHDGFNDCKISYQPYISDLRNSYTKFTVFQLPSNILQINVHPNTQWYYGCPDSLYAKKFRYGDTMAFTSTSESNFISYVQYEYCVDPPMPHFPPCSGTARFTDITLSPDYDDYYYLFERINNTDTMLGYVHMNYNSVLDYAIEGPTSYFIDGLPNDLSTDKSITTYPNPFTNQININYTKPFDYQITDYIGGVVAAGKAERTINTNDLPAGNYLLLMKNEEMMVIKKVMKNP